ncbi:MAG TPA: hypothetical protein VJ302_33220, partial [Blastocatellia bacterium]|nr:hypothetical protein [Blastocatellia bacterium]
MFAHDARELIWPGFSARDEEFGDRRPVDIQLPNDTRASLPLDFFGEGIWGTTGSGAFWDWIDACRAQSGDGLLITAIDAEARQYRIAIDAESARDTEAARHRTEEVESAARDYLRRNRHRAPAIWDLARHLLAAGHYQYAVPPEPVSYIWNRIQFFPYDQRTSLAEKAAGGRRASAKKAQPIYYEYDFGDCWRHEVTVEKIRPPQEGESYPQCIAGARACPPEDCG